MVDDAEKDISIHVYYSVNHMHDIINCSKHCIEQTKAKQQTSLDCILYYNTILIHSLQLINSKKE